MILTGKAKKDFFNYVYELGLQELLIYDVSYNAMVIEWFDSVGIYIEVSIWHRHKDELYFGWKIGNNIGALAYHNKLHATSRHEATKQAIIKANEIYNETNKTTAPVY